LSSQSFWSSRDTKNRQGIIFPLAASALVTLYATFQGFDKILAAPQNYLVPPTKTAKPIDPSPAPIPEAKQMRTITPKDATRILRFGEKRIVLENGVVKAYHANALASNSPIEDEQSAHSLPGRGHVWGVYDGHGGWVCSQKVSAELPIYVGRALDAHAVGRIGRSEKEISKVVQAIQSAFIDLDKDIVNVVERLRTATPYDYPRILFPALTGSCALLAFISEDNLFVACTGDSRAVLGVKDPTKGGWVAHPMSVDQTAKNPDEVKRLKLEHPGEEEAVASRGRVLGGLEPSRAFGDARYKWTAQEQEEVFKCLPGGRPVPKDCVTPPYVTSLPEVTHRRLGPNDRFLIMATDGLWDELSSEEAVQLVGGWLDGAKEPISQTSSEKTKHFTFVDSDNAATHLIRNALGGADEDALCALLGIPLDNSRWYRDDISVTVVFFGDDGKQVGQAKIIKAKL